MTTNWVEDFFKKLHEDVLLDIGSGYGRNLEIMLRLMPNTYFVGLDIDLNKLKAFKCRLKDGYFDVIWADAARIPIRANVIDIITMFMTLHELEIKIIDDVLREIWRVLKPNKYFIIVDKVRDCIQTPAEKLTLLTENTYHKAKKYVLNYHAYGVRKSEEVISKIISYGFKIINHEIIKYSEWIPGDRFLKVWGRETLSLYEKIRDEREKREIGRLINKIREEGMKYGYGPVKALVILLTKFID